MPATATITSYYSFTANTKARASQVTANFDVWRGHHIPVDPNTQTSANLTYDLGSEDWRWRTVYAREVDFQSSTLGASLKIKGDTSYTAGAFVFEVEGVERHRINSTVLMTSTATKGNMAFSGAITYAMASIPVTFINIPGSTITLTTIGKPVDLGFLRGSITVRADANPGDAFLSLAIFANNTQTAGFGFGFLFNLATNSTQDLYLPGSAFRDVVEMSASTYTIDLRIRAIGSVKAEISNIKMYAKEI